MNFEKRPSIENPQISPKALSEQKTQWEKVRAEIERDPEMKGVDEGIREAVIAFNINGIPTWMSCEGHIKEWPGNEFFGPWVMARASDEPEWHFEYEEENYKQVAKKYDVPLRQVKISVDEEPHKEAEKLSAGQEETPEYKKWQEENGKLFAKIEALLEEFYAKHSVPDDVRLVADRMVESIWVHNGINLYIPNNEKIERKKLTEEEQQHLPEVLKNCQKEMQNFADFLKKKYLSQNS